RQTLEGLEQRLAVVADRIDVELRGAVGGVQGDVEVLEARPQRLQGEAGIGEGAEMGGHAEGGEADALRQLDVLEELGVIRRSATREEEHVELARPVEDGLPG